MLLDNIGGMPNPEKLKETRDEDRAQACLWNIYKGAGTVPYSIQII